MTTTPITDSADEATEATVRRLARPHASGGAVIERAAILAEGATSATILTWIGERAGEPEFAKAPSGSSGGLHGGRGGAGREHPPLRYVLPPGTLNR